MERVFTPLTVNYGKLYDEIKGQEFFKPNPRPLQERSEKNYCKFHGLRHHATEDCKSFKHYVEILIKQGLLGQYVRAPQQTQEIAQVAKEPMVIIPAVFCDEDVPEYSTRETRKKIEQICAVYELSHGARAVPQVAKAGDIVFSSVDLAKVILPHNDPLIIHVYFGGKQIRESWLTMQRT